MERTHEKTEAEGYDHLWRLFLVSGLHTRMQGSTMPHRIGPEPSERQSPGKVPSEWQSGVRSARVMLRQSSNGIITS